MKKILLSSSKFQGDISLMYDQDSVISLIDFQETDLDEKQANYFLRNVPSLFAGVEQLLSALNSKFLSAIESEYLVSFEQWWKDYDNPINKARCLKIWNRMSEVDRVKAFVGNRGYRRHLQLNPWKNKMNPESYLKGRCWENEYR